MKTKEELEEMLVNMGCVWPSFIAGEVLKLLVEEYKAGQRNALNALFNTETKGIFKNQTLTDIYYHETNCEFDEGWDSCFESFAEVREIIEKKEGLNESRN